MDKAKEDDFLKEILSGNIPPVVDDVSGGLPVQEFPKPTNFPPPELDKDNWIRPEWRDYYTQTDSGFNLWIYFQQTADFIPTMTIDKNRYTVELAIFLAKNGVCINRKNVLSKEGETLLNHAYYLYKENIVEIYYREDNSNYKISFFHHPDVHPPVKDFKSFVVKKSENHISVLLQNKYEGFYSEPCDMQVPRGMDLALNYGDAFVSKHNGIVEKFLAGGASFFLFSGPPGTGKTTYIKYLSSLVQREFIFIPVSLVGSLASPEMLSFLISKKGAVLVLEDAEKAVRTRDDNMDTDVVSTLLNMSDGILGNVLNISIIATYNAERETVDKAFLRKGRLKFEHEFKPLSVNETNRLLDHLKLPHSKTPLTLAEIYNLNDDTGHVDKVRPAIGFGVTPKS